MSEARRRPAELETKLAVAPFLTRLTDACGDLAEKEDRYGTWGPANRYLGGRHLPLGW